MGVLSPLGEYDPSRLRDTATSLVLSQVFEPLYAFADAATGLQPVLAAELPRALDSRSQRYAIPIREGIVFSDGTPLTPSLVVASLSRPGGFTAQAELSAGKGEILVTLRAPHPNFALYLTQAATGIALEKEGRYLGTGPFLLPEMSLELARTAPEIALARNPNDRDAAATGVDELRVRRFASSEELARALQDGSIHFTDALPAAGGEVTGKGIYPIPKTGISTGILFVNTERLPDARVRRAILRSVARAEIAGKSYDVMPMAYVASRLLPTALGEEGTSYPNADLPLAKRLFEEAAARQRRLTLLVTWGPKAYMPRPKEAAEAIREQLAAALGITVEIVLPTRDEYYKRQKAGDYDILLGGWIPDTPDPSDFYESLLASTAVPGLPTASASGNNLSRWRDQETDRLLAEHRADPTVARRAALTKHVTDSGVLTPLLLGKFVAYVSWDVKRVTVSALGRAQFRGATVHA
jgi:peptide/nickel transport system substrate-binding protein